MAGLLSSCATTGIGAKDSSGPKRVVMISIDGLRPEFYLSDRFVTPNLHALVRDGVSATGVRPVAPSQTYPNHATLLTGVLPREHGIESNRIFSTKAAPDSDLWHWFAADVHALTLWQSAKNAGRKVAILRWPSTVGANVDWSIPEIFGTPGIDLHRDFKIATSMADPVFMTQALNHLGRAQIDTIADLDDLAASTAQMLLQTDNPDFMLVHLIQADMVQHLTGRDSQQTKDAIEAVDRLVGQIRNALNSEFPTDIIIVGDHGFADYDNVVHPNKLFADRAWLLTKDGRITDWSVVADAEGPQALIYVKKTTPLAAVKNLLLANARLHYTVLDGAALKQLGLYPLAAFAIIANKGYTIAQDTIAPSLVTHEPALRGQHGYDSDMPEMSTGFLAAGPGIAKGRSLGAIDILAIAPTVAALLQIPLPAAKNEPLNLK